jgi:regulatory protein
VQEDASSSQNAKYSRAEKSALRLIARAEQCTTGLRRKLLRRGHEEDCIEKVISRLLELKLIDDERYARLWVQSRLRLTRTPRRLLISLVARGIDRDTAEDALKTALDEDAECALLTRFAKKHLRKAAGKKEEGSASLKYLLKSEGFSPELVSRMVSNLQEN